MGIFTSMTFWIIIVAIIVILAIIGYIAEGTILSSKNEKDEEKIEKSEDNIWTNPTSIEEKNNQETEYKTADKSWLDIPNVDNVAKPTSEQTKEVPSLEPVQATPEAVPSLEPVQAMPETVPSLEPVQATPEAVPSLEQTQFNQLNNGKTVEKTDIWTN